MDIIEDVLSKMALKDMEDIVTTKISINIPELTKEKVEESILKLRSVEKNNGITNIGITVGLTSDQVALIDRKRKEKINELKNPIIEEIEKVE